MKLGLLHLVDLGVASHISGSFLAALVNGMGMGRVKALVELNKMIATEYQHLGIQSGNRLPRPNVSDIFTDDFPCLRHVKGRRIRKFAPVATKLAAKLAPNVRGKHMHCANAWRKPMTFVTESHLRQGRNLLTNVKPCLPTTAG